MPSRIPPPLPPGSPPSRPLGTIPRGIRAHTRPAEARIFHRGKHAVQGVAELMKCRADLIVRQQRRLARRRFWDVEMIRYHRSGTEQIALLHIGIHPRATAL